MGMGNAGGKAGVPIRHCENAERSEADEAIQSLSFSLDCFVAIAPRNDSAALTLR
jgi:hypothetical protein